MTSVDILKTAENFYNQFKQALPHKVAFNGQKNEAIDLTHNTLRDINQDGQLNIADVFHDGSLTQKELKALKEHTLKDVQTDDRLEAEVAFDKGMAAFLEGQQKAELQFLTPLQILSQGKSNHELLFFDVNRQEGYDKVDLITGNLNIHLIDKDGFYVDSKDDMSLTLNGEAVLDIALPDDLKLPAIVTASANNQKISLTLMGLYEVFALELKEQEKSAHLVVTPPSQSLINLAKKFNVDIDEFTPDTLAELLKIDRSLITQKGEHLWVNLDQLINTKFPEGITMAGKKVKPHKISLEGLSFQEASRHDNHLKITLGLENYNLNMGTGTQPTQGHIDETIDADLALRDIKIGQTEEPLAAMSTLHLSLANITEDLKIALNETAEGALKELTINWQGNQMHISAKLADAPVKLNIPVTIDNTTLSFDLAKTRALGIPVPKLAERLQQYLANKTHFQSKLTGSTISLNLDEMMAKEAPQIGETHRLEHIQLENGTLTLTLTKNSRDPQLMKPPQKQPPQYPRHEINTTAGYETGGSGVFGINYSYNVPMGQSLIGRAVGADKNLGKLPGVSYTYLDRTYSAGTSVGTDGSVRIEGLTGVRVSGNPFGMPAYAKIEPVGIGVKMNKNGARPYIPTKVELGYDDGKWNVGAYYQHNTVINGKDDNIVGVTAAVRW